MEELKILILNFTSINPRLVFRYLRVLESDHKRVGGRELVFGGGLNERYTKEIFQQIRKSDLNRGLTSHF
jgi:hypothetical protein